MSNSQNVQNVFNDLKKSSAIFFEENLIFAKISAKKDISKTGNGESGNGNGEWGMGMGNLLKGGISKRGNY